LLHITIVKTENDSYIVPINGISIYQGQEKGMTKQDSTILWASATPQATCGFRITGNINLASANCSLSLGLWKLSTCTSKYNMTLKIKEHWFSKIFRKFTNQRLHKCTGSFKVMGSNLIRRAHKQTKATNCFKEIALISS